MEAGAYLYQLLRSKHIQLTKLAGSIGLKSRNVLYRIFNGTASYEKMSEIITEIVNTVDFTDEEKRELYRLLVESKKGGFFVKSREILSNVYKETPSDGFVFTYKKKEYKLGELLGAWETAEGFLCIGRIDDVRIIGDVYNLLKANPSIKAYGYLRFLEHDISTAYEILSLMELAPLGNYHPYHIETVGFTGVKLLGKCENKFFTASMIYAHDEYIPLATEIPEAMYNYSVEINRHIIRNGSAVKDSVMHITDFIKGYEDTLEFDMYDNFLSEGAPCFGYLGYDLLYEKLREIDCFGFPEEHPIIQQLLGVLKMRRSLFLEGSYTKQFLFDVRSLDTMLQTGISVDHPSEFRPLDREQLKNYFEWLIGYAKKHPEKLQCRVLRDGRIKYPFAHVKRRLLSAYSSDEGYTYGSKIILRSDAVNEIMDDFTEYVWEHYTYSDEESIEIMQDIIKKHFD